jgi:hypothetical protein
LRSRALRFGGTGTGGSGQGDFLCSGGHGGRRKPRL